MQLIRFKNGEMNAVGNQQLKERREEKRKKEKKRREEERENGEQCPQHG